MTTTTCQRCDALCDAIETLRDFIEGKRNDAENISQIINGALNGYKSESIENDFALRHYMRDVVVLLGGKQEIADILDKSQDGVTDSDVDKVRQCAIELIEEQKRRITSLHKLSIHTQT